MASKVSLKLFIDTKARKVLYAEADKNFVDFLFYIISMPVASVFKLVDNNSVLGSLGKFYNSVNNLSNTYLQPNKDKAAILNPKFPIPSTDKAPLLLPSDLFKANKFYTCYNYNTPHKAIYLSDQLSIVCPDCMYSMSKELSYVSPKKVVSSGSGDGGFVKGDVTYMVMDDLEVKPLSTASSISVLTKFNIKDVGSIQEKDVQLGVDEGLKLLKAAISSQSVLTTVFLA